MYAARIVLVHNNKNKVILYSRNIGVLIFIEY